MRFTITVIFCIAASLSAGAKIKRPRIVNGDHAVQGQFPWQVSIINHLQDELQYCTGAFISDEWILTSAHCVDNADFLVAVYGFSDLDDPGDLVERTENYVVHEDYDPTTLANDIGLIRLENPIEFSDSVKAIALAEDELAAGTEVTVSGWGHTSDDDPSDRTPILRYITVPTISNEECAAVYGSDYVDAGKVCTTGGENPVKSPCIGDGGAPAVINADTDPLHVAIFSFNSNSGCETPDFPAGYTRTAYYRDWITRNAGV